MATTGISLVREQTAAMRLSRFLWVPFELGRPFGAPNEADFQRRVLAGALALVEHAGPGPVLADFPDDAPVTDEDVVWACPVSFAPQAADDRSLVDEVRAEMATLAPWAEAVAAPPPTSGMALADLVALLGAAAAGDDTEALIGDCPRIEAIRLAADDLRTWYLHAVAQQPGGATSQERMTWLWRQTALGRLLGVLAGRLVDDPDPTMRMFADRAIVPRDHWDAVVPDPPPRGDEHA